MPVSSHTAAAFDRWVAEHVAVLYRVAYRLPGNQHDAEDVVQDAFRSAWTSRHLDDRSRSERAWLLAILRRQVADHWRRRETRPEAPDGEIERPAPEPADPFADELSASMQRALGGGALPAGLADRVREAAKARGSGRSGGVVDLAFELALGESPFVDPAADAASAVNHPPLTLRTEGFEALLARRAGGARGRVRVEEVLAAMPPPGKPTASRVTPATAAPGCPHPTAASCWWPPASMSWPPGRRTWLARGR